MKPWPRPPRAPGKGVHGSVIAALLAAMACVACEPPLDMRLDPSFTGADVEQIVEAARRWNGITNEAHKITFDGDTWYVVKAPPPGGRWDGLTRRSERRIWLHPTPSGGGNYVPLAMHEFGHALGLGHLCSHPNAKGRVIDGAPECISGESLGVMDPLAGSEAFSEGDIRECFEVGAC